VTCIVPECDGDPGVPGAARGYCPKHYSRWRRHGDPNVYGNRIVGDDDTRFWSHVDKDGPIPEHRPDLGPCWVWTASTYQKGYGQLRLSGSRNTTAHRWGYLRYVGHTDLDLDHLCRNKRCVNPSHLEPVTAAENNRRKDEARALGI